MKNIKIIQELHDLGITGYHEVVYNPTYEELYQAEISHRRKGYEKGAHTDTGAIAVKTGVFTGRSPKDRYIVKDEITKDTICWDKESGISSPNYPTTKAIWDDLKALTLEHPSRHPFSDQRLISSHKTRYFDKCFSVFMFLY